MKSSAFDFFSLDSVLDPSQYQAGPHPQSWVRSKTRTKLWGGFLVDQTDIKGHHGRDHKHSKFFQFEQKLTSKWAIVVEGFLQCPHAVRSGGITMRIT